MVKESSFDLSCACYLRFRTYKLLPLPLLVAVVWSILAAITITLQLLKKELDSYRLKMT